MGEWKWRRPNKGRKLVGVGVASSLFPRLHSVLFNQLFPRFLFPFFNDFPLFFIFYLCQKAACFHYLVSFHKPQLTLLPAALLSLNSFKMIEFFEYHQLLCATDGFSAARLIGKGSHGSVYKAILEDNTVVAVKKPLQSKVEAAPAAAFRDSYSKLENEARVLWSLRQSPLVVNFLGTSLDSANNKLLVMEFMSNGSLHDLLLAATPNSSSHPHPLTWPKRLQIITQIARAVKFLHQANPLVIHRDIKAENILFDSNWNLKLADFGLAVSPSDFRSHAGQPAGTIGYLDPCYTTPSKLSTKSDVFSFGVVVLEVISGRKAMDISKSPASIVEWARPLIEQQNFHGIYDGRIPLPKYLVGRTRKVLELAGRCVCAEQGKRPSMGEILEAMEMETSCCCIEPLNFFQIPLWSRLAMLIRMRRRRKKKPNFKCCTTRQAPNS